MSAIFGVPKAASLSPRFRRKRFALFRTLLDRVQRPVRILDVGGTEAFWDMMQFPGAEDVEITLFNIEETTIVSPGFKSVVGDARDMTRFRTGEFDVVFSNSVIEHLGTLAAQRQMAREVQRVGQRYFVQTPNKSFPVEPHFLFPFFQFFPLEIRVWLLMHFNLGWRKRTPDYHLARSSVEEIRLLTRSELRQLFPGASVVEENWAGLAKSFIMYRGWGDAT